MPFEIGGRRIGPGQPLFVIAELGLNHGGSVDTALALVDAAADAGASAVKLQTIHADRLVSASCPPPAHVNVDSLREFFRRFELDGPAHHAVAARARARGLAMMSTPFSEDAVQLLQDVGCDALKIASGDVTHHHLIARAACTGLPLVISTGMSTLPEIGQALECARQAGAANVALLHCVSAYPVPSGSENLRAIAELARVFGVPVGLSDHSADSLSLPLAVSLGASLYERHFVLDAESRGVDAPLSATPAQLRDAIAVAARAAAALGSGVKTCLPAERANLEASRRGLYAARDLREGDSVDDRAIVALRPFAGLDARRWTDLVGTRMIRPLRAGEPFLSIDIEPRHETRSFENVA